MRALGKILYWLVVVLISLALVVALILFLESRDQSSVEGRAQPGDRPSRVVESRAASSRISEVPGMLSPLR